MLGGFPRRSIDRSMALEDLASHGNQQIHVGGREFSGFAVPT